VCSSDLPRVAADPRYDFLHRPERGKLEWYSPEDHGTWTIERDDDGNFAICCDDGELTYPKKQGPKTTASITQSPPRATRAVPVTQSQVDAANRLHARLAQWSSTDGAFRRLAAHFPGWDREACILKAAVINDLYSTRVYAIWRMADHLMQVMEDPPTDSVALVAAIAGLPLQDDGDAKRKHWSFASKVCHFFVDGTRFPIYDSYCRDMIVRHLGRANCVSDEANPYRAFVTNLDRLRSLSALSASLRDLDRYLWLAGQYRDWLKKGDQAPTNAELRSLFEAPSPEDAADLRDLVPDLAGTV
jgi:hypothetical protein